MGDQPAGDRWAFVPPVVNHVRAHLGFYRPMAEAGAGPLVEAEFARVLDALVINALRVGGPTLESAMLTGAVAGGVAAWIGGRTPMDEAALVAVLRRLDRPER